LILRLHSRGVYRPCESCDFTKSNCVIYVKPGNMAKKSEKKSGKLSTKSGKNRNFHIQYYHYIRPSAWVNDFADGMRRSPGKTLVIKSTEHCLTNNNANLNPFVPRESKFFGKIGQCIRIRRFQNTSNQFRTLSSFRKTKFSSVLELYPFKVGTSHDPRSGSLGVRGLKSRNENFQMS